MLETCRGGPRSIILRIENVDQDFQKQPWRPKWTNFSLHRPVSTNLKPLQRVCPTCWRDPRHISLHVENTQNFDKVVPPGPRRPNF